VIGLCIFLTLKLSTRIRTFPTQKLNATVGIEADTGYSQTQRMFVTLYFKKHSEIQVHF